jgi:hypothetical protein
MDFAHAVHPSGIEEDSFRRCGFAGIDVRSNTNITELMESKPGHDAVEPLVFANDAAMLHRLIPTRAMEQPGKSGCQAGIPSSYYHR